MAILAALLAVALMLAVLGGGWKWGGKPAMTAGWAWGDDGGELIDLTPAQATTPAFSPDATAGATATDQPG